jgi:hypothetical protein
LFLLRTRLIGLAERDNDPSRQRHHARPACRFCMARRGVTEPVYCWIPDHRTVCHRHYRWIGPGNRTHDDQRDLRDAPVVLVAARRHARLHRNHCHAAHFVVTDATRVLRWWTATPSVALSTATTSVDTYIRVYPDLIDLANILADGGRKIVDTPRLPSLDIGHSSHATCSAQPLHDNAFRSVTGNEPLYAGMLAEAPDLRSKGRGGRL